MPQAGILAKLRTGPWTPEANPAAIPAGLQVASPQAVSELALAIELKQRPSEGSKTVVECGWIQTVLVGGVRQDRVIYRFHSGEQQLRIALPPGATSLEVTLDQKPVEIDKDDRGEFFVPLAAGDGNEHLLELSYRFPRRSLGGRLQADPPEIRPAPPDAPALLGIDLAGVRPSAVGSGGIHQRICLGAQRTPLAPRVES